MSDDGWPNNFDAFHWLSLAGSAVAAAAAWVWHELTDHLLHETERMRR